MHTLTRLLITYGLFIWELLGHPTVNDASVGAWTDSGHYNVSQETIDGTA